jgi:hypothetical protein
VFCTARGMGIVHMLVVEMPLLVMVVEQALLVAELMAEQALLVAVVLVGIVAWSSTS